MHDIEGNAVNNSLLIIEMLFSRKFNSFLETNEEKIITIGSV
jgi:hypothetical protein